jgi:hypothetical protein
LQEGSIGTHCHLLLRQHGRSVVRAARTGSENIRQARRAHGGRRVQGDGPSTQDLVQTLDDLV